MVCMYLFSTVVALVAAAVLGRTVFKGPQVPLILELPPYRMPQWRSVLRMMSSRAGVFLREAGGVILACTIVLWALLSFPRDPRLDRDYVGLRAEAETSLVGEARDARLVQLDHLEAAELLQHSYGGRLGQAIEPTIEPLGFDWKIGVGLISSFAAREVVVSALGTIYSVADQDEYTGLMDAMKRDTYPDGRPVWTPLVAASLLIFFVFACQCMATLAVVRRETASWRWPLFMWAYMFALAYGASLLVYQGGKLLGWS
jgi:ferrous iron transport protein B